MSKTVKIIIVCATVIISGFAFWDVPRNKVTLLWEKDTIENTAHAYLNAEMKKNSQLVYALLAPSSDYKKTHSYENYLNDLKENPPLSMNEYKIVRIYNLRSNDNKENYPEVDKFVQVEVEITFSNAGPNNIFNYSFTFLKEKGNWYKG